MSFTVVIPARYASTRLPAKPLVDLVGKPMIQRVVERASQSRASKVVVATDDPRIESRVRNFGATAVMTSPDHASGTDRIEEVARMLELEDNAIVVNVQGDEPLVPPGVIDQVAELLANSPDAAAATLCTPIVSLDELLNPNAVKVVASSEGDALYFSRAPIPWDRNHPPIGGGELTSNLSTYYRHLGIYAYRVSLLRDFVRWGAAPLESIECLEQLRILYHGHKIRVMPACDAIPAGVDTEDDLTRVRAIILREENA